MALGTLTNTAATQTTTPSPRPFRLTTVDAYSTDLPDGSFAPIEWLVEGLLIRGNVQPCGGQAQTWARARLRGLLPLSSSAAR